MHPGKRLLVERVPGVFAEDTTVREHERRIRELEQLMRKSAGDDRGPGKLLGPEGLTAEKKVALVRKVKDEYGVPVATWMPGLARSRW